MDWIDFLKALLTSVIMIFHSEFALAVKVEPQDLLPEYDFVIVGAGSAGCVLANRLSENESWKILLMEAGGEENAISDTPYLSSELQNTSMDWNYTTVKQEKTCGALNGFCLYPRGRVLGGSSTINAMKYVRGNKADFDEWAEKGSDGWSYEDVLPYFKKLENTSLVGRPQSPYRGYGGPQTVQYSVYNSSLWKDYVKAGNEFGMEEVDYNGIEQQGIARLQFTVKGPSRDSTSKAYLDPIKGRTNLHISIYSEAYKIDIDPGIKVANGVWFEKNGTQYFVKARKEVILSAGSINSPKLLMLSGIGPREHLMSLGIQVIADLPVGNNLQDHILSPVSFILNQSDVITQERAYSSESVIEYTEYQEGPLTSPRFEATAFLNVLNHDSNLPNVQFYLGISGAHYYPNEDDFAPKLKVATCASILIKPKSRGWVRLNSSSPSDPPLIDTQYFHEQIDIKVAKLGLRALFQFMSMPSMKALSAKPITNNLPICDNYEIGSDDLINCIISQYSSTLYHPVGTAKMGPEQDPTSVVSTELLVWGMKNLRVIDASIMPTIPRGNTNAPAIMIGEKGSDIIKSKYI